MNRVNFLRNYIIESKNDSGGSWEYSHTPFLTDYLKNLTELESIEFSNKIFEWNEDELYEIADPIIWCENKFLDADYLYCKIFSKIDKSDYLEYLIENIIPYIHHIPNIRIQVWELDLLCNLNEKVLKTLSVKDVSWNLSLKKVTEFLEEHIKSRINNYS